jgi:hypothetical protein
MCVFVCCVFGCGGGGFCGIGAVFGGGVFAVFAWVSFVRASRLAVSVNTLASLLITSVCLF